MFNYNEMDEIVPLERCLEIIETDKKGERTFHREKNKKIVCTVGDREITVKYNLALPMQALWDTYTRLFEPEGELEEEYPDDDDPVYYDPCDVMRKVKAGPPDFDPRSGENFISHFSRDAVRAVRLTMGQTQKRYLWFARACALCGTEDRLQRLAELFPKKKDGCLHRRRVLRIATLFCCDKDGSMKELVARDTGERELVVTIRDAYLLPDGPWSALRDVASTTDLFDFR